MSTKWSLAHQLLLSLRVKLSLVPELFSHQLPLQRWKGDLGKIPDQVAGQIFYWIPWSFPRQTGEALSKIRIDWCLSWKGFQAPVAGWVLQSGPGTGGWEGIASPAWRACCSGWQSCWTPPCCCSPRPPAPSCSPPSPHRTPPLRIPASLVNPTRRGDHCYNLPADMVAAAGT